MSHGPWLPKSIKASTYQPEAYSSVVCCLLSVALFNLCHIQQYQHSINSRSLALNEIAIAIDQSTKLKLSPPSPSLIYLSKPCLGPCACPATFPGSVPEVISQLSYTSAQISLRPPSPGRGTYRFHGMHALTT